MKKAFVSGLIFSIFSLIFIFGFDVSAERPTISERFDMPGKKTEGVSGAYNFDKNHSSIGFRVKHFGLVDVPGYFRDFTGTINYDSKDVTKSSVEFKAQAASVDTGVKGRDDHLRREDFFFVEKYPDLTFKSTKVEKKGKNLMITGDLTMRGVTKSVTFPFTIAGFLTDARSNSTRIGVTAETQLNRRDFGVNYGSNLPNGTAAISDNVIVVLNIEAILPAQAAR